MIVDTRIFWYQCCLASGRGIDAVVGCCGGDHGYVTILYWTRRTQFAGHRWLWASVTATVAAAAAATAAVLTCWPFRVYAYRSVPVRIWLGGGGGNGYCKRHQTNTTSPHRLVSRTSYYYFFFFFFALFSACFRSAITRSGVRVHAFVSKHIFLVCAYI